jgi:hypothetical protein
VREDVVGRPLRVTERLTTASHSAARAAQDSILMMWNVVLGVAIMLWAFGYAQTKQLFSRPRRQEAHEEGSA